MPVPEEAEAETVARPAALVISRVFVPEETGAAQSECREDGGSLFGDYGLGTEHVVYPSN